MKTADIDEIMLLEYINLNESIKFTVEREANNSTSFLDVKIMRQINGELKFKVHRKPTSNDRYLDFISCNPIQHKVTTIKALQRTAYTICSDEESKTEKLNTLRKDLNNGYPKHLIDKCEKEVTKPV